MPEEKLHTRRYDWDDLLSRKGKVRLLKDTDYNGMSSNFSIHFRETAKKKGYRVSIHVGEKYIEYEVVGKVTDKSKVSKNGRKK